MKKVKREMRTGSAGSPTGLEEGQITYIANEAVIQRMFDRQDDLFSGCGQVLGKYNQNLSEMLSLKALAGHNWIDENEAL